MMSSRTVLLVEDNPLSRKLMRVTLESQGCCVLEATDGAAAMDQLDARPDLVIQDLLLPDIDGLELRDRIRRWPGAQATPVIAVSGHLPRLHAPEAAEAGFAARLTKPVEPSRLLQAVRAALPEGVPALVTGGPRVLVADDDDVQRKLTRLRLTHCGYDVIEARDGRAALAAARAERPDAVIADVLMPGLDGFELCLAIRRDPGIATVPVVLASSRFVAEDDRALGEQAGASAYVSRESHHASVLEALERALGGRAAPPEPDAERYAEAHAERLSQQLLVQSAAHARIAAQLAEREAQLAVMSGISEALARTRDLGAAMGDILARCVEATGVGGAEFRPHPGAGLGSPIRVGVPPVVVGHGPLVVPAGGDAVIGDGIVLDLRRDAEPLAQVVLGTRDRPPADREVMLCRAVAHQLRQAVALARANAELVVTREHTVRRLAEAVALRDGGTAAHSSRMSASCHAIAAGLGLPPDRCALLRDAASLHDIGKVATADAILGKPGPLSDAEREEIRRHPEVGYGLLHGTGSELLELAASIALHHHERWDGTGYPHGLRGDVIPLEARIAAPADVFDALMSDRPYRAALSREAALAELEAGRGSHFDPAVLDVFLAWLERGGA